MSHQHLDNINIETNIRGFQSRVLVDLESALIKQLILNPNDKIPLTKYQSTSHFLY